MEAESITDIPAPVAGGPVYSIPTGSSTEPPLFRECDIQFLQQQMRQHIQLLCQAYVLTVSTDDVALNRISKLASGMIVELKNFARENGATSNFGVCNLDPAWSLVNYWPHKTLLQSPLKKKILEKNVNESSVNNKDAIKFFPRHVVKVIAESPAFLYNNLLPECYHQKKCPSKVSFSYWEDALLVSALDDCKESKQTTHQLAELISAILLVAYQSTQIYHRIRNLRKRSPSSKTCNPAVLKYFSDGTVPLPDRTVTEISQMWMDPLLQRDRTNMTPHWNALLRIVEDTSASPLKWMEKLKKDPITKSVARKWNRKGVRQQKTIARKKPSKKNPQDVPKRSSDVIDRAFPGTTLEVENRPGMEAIPLLGADGRPGAIIYIPKYALLGAGTQNPKPAGLGPSRVAVVAPQSQESSESGKQQPCVDSMNNGQLQEAESQKKARKSQGSSHRASKDSVASTEKMLQEDTSDFEEVTDAYMEAYLMKVQSITEAQDPGIYTALIQLLMDIDAGEANMKQHELHGKVKVLFTDYPELLREFESFLTPDLNVKIEGDPAEVGSSMYEYTVAQVTFMQQLEKFTENCPHLKAKVLDKVKVLKESGCVTEKEMATSLEPFFMHNPVIMDSFEAFI